MADTRRSGKEFVRGIFNYCDRWCERCPATSRCRVFAMTEPHAETCDISNAEFWERLHRVFERTLTAAREAAARHGIDLDADDGGEAAEAIRRSEEAAESHPCATAAMAYGEAAEKWLKMASPAMAAKEAELLAQLRMELPGAEPESDAAAIRDALEIIQWHQRQIWVKLMRALDDPFPPDASESEKRAITRDSDGSAKVALIGIDRSIAAWGTLLKHFPEEELALLEFLAQLSRLRRGVEASFPNARAFVRPWFDERRSS